MTVSISKEHFQILKETMSKDETRYYLMKPYYDAAEKKIVATDGRRMVVIDLEIPEFTESTYLDLVKVGKTFGLVKSDLDAQFPNWKNVMPDYAAEAPIMENFSFENDSVNNSRFFCDIVLAIGQAINMDWTVKTLKKVFISSLKKGPEERNPLEFSFNGGVYILMPMGKPEK